MRILVFLRLSPKVRAQKRVRKFLSRDELVEAILYEGKHVIGSTGRSIKVKRGEVLLVSRSLQQSEVLEALSELDRKARKAERKGLARRKMMLIVED